MSNRNGGAAVVESLAVHGVDAIFGIPGTHNLELYRHFGKSGIRAITPRHEQCAGYAAEAYARVSGRPGVVVTTSGPGLTNAMTAAATAYAESQPMLLIPITVTAGTETSVELRNAWQRAWAQFRTSQSPIDYVRVSGMGV